MSNSDPAPPSHFSDRLADALDRAGSVACVGLDPVAEKLPPELLKDDIGSVEQIKVFCRGVLEAVAPHVGAVKLQSACFEAEGPFGFAALREMTRAAHARGLLVIHDAKRGDIGISAEHYATWAFGTLRGTNPTHAADALTVSGYLGPDTVEPFLKPGRGAFVLVRTSNPGSDAVQSLKLADGRTVAEMMADHVAVLGASRRGQRGLSDVGAVVGATKPADAASMRRHMPDSIFLVPGYGAQGGTLDDVRSLVRPGARSPGELGVMVTASRSVIYPARQPGESWQDAIARAARQLSDELTALNP